MEEYRLIWLCVQIETIPREGMLRVGGRLQHSTPEYQSKHQLLLPSKHHVTKLLIMDVHESVGHLGQEYVLTNLRQKYWVVHGRAAVRRVLGNCLTCRKQNALKSQQIMADLPSDRLTLDDLEFSYVGIIIIYHHHHHHLLEQLT